MKGMVCKLALAALALSVDADDEATTSCATPAPGVIDETLAHDVVWTERAGHHGSHLRSVGEEGSRTKVSITLKHLVWADAWDCFSWDVELLLPEGVSMVAGESAKSTGNNRDSVAEFDVLVDAHSAALGVYEGRDLRGSFRVTFQPTTANDANHGQPAEGGGRGLHWHYPVVFRAERSGSF